MSHIQWLGIWGMTGFSEPEERDWSNWSKGVGHVLKDPKGRHYFKEFLKQSGRGFENYVKFLKLWVRLDKLLIQDEPVNQNKVQKILGEAQRYLSMPACDVSDLQVAIESKNEDKIRKVQGIARDELTDVYDMFVKSLPV